MAVARGVSIKSEPCQSSDLRSDRRGVAGPGHVRCAEGLRLNRCLLVGLFVVCCLISTGHSAAVKTGCRKHGTQHVIDEPGCDLVAVNINMCTGYCVSFSFPNPGENSITVHGKCCRMVDTEWITVKVNCDDGERKMKIPSALECRCFDCA